MTERSEGTNGQSTDEPTKEKLGSAAEEAAKLAAALQDFARRTTGDRIATGAAECRLCPLCQLISFLRDTNPAVVEHLTTAAEALVLALRAAVPGQHPHHRERPGVQHIDIG